MSVFYSILFHSLFLVVFVQAQPSSSFILNSPHSETSHKIEVQGHRGVRSLIIENTLSSFALAIEMEIDVIEMDVLMTKDGELVIHHDFFLSKGMCRTCPLVKSLTLAEVKKFEFREGHPQFPYQKIIKGEKIPTLSEVFILLETSLHPHAKKIRLNIELKRDPRNPSFTVEPMLFAKKVLSEVNKFGFQNRVYYSSFDPEVLFYLRKEEPTSQLGFIFSEQVLNALNRFNPRKGKDLLVKLAAFLKVKIISPEHSVLKDRSVVSYFQERGYKVIPWTVNDKERWKELIELGVDGLITDYPHILQKFIK